MIEVIKSNNVYIAKGQYNKNVRLVIYKLLMNHSPVDIYIEYHDETDCTDKVVKLSCECLADWKKYEKDLRFIFKGNLNNIKYDPAYNIFNHGEIIEKP